VGGVTNIELVQKRSLWGYRGDEIATFMKITVTDPKAVPRVRDECTINRCIVSFLPVRLVPRVFERGETNFRNLFSGPVTTFESNIPFVLRCMIDVKVNLIEYFCDAVQFCHRSSV
jgi:DNA polymerase delta subunit 1